MCPLYMMYQSCSQFADSGAGGSGDSLLEKNVAYIPLFFLNNSV